MPALRILLIEDSIADRVLFINQIQSEFGHDVTVDCAEKIGEAFHCLETAQRTGELYSQIWLDPGLPDLGTQNVGSVLAQLKKHVGSGELLVLTSGAAPEVARQAKQHSVPVINKEALQPSGNLEVLAIVRELLVKRSGGQATVRVEQARLEGRIMHLEERCEKIEALVSPLTAIEMELKFIKHTLTELVPLKEDVGALRKANADQGQIRLKRLDVIQAIGIVIISAVVAPIVVSMMGNKGTPAANLSPSPSPSPSPTSKPPSSP